jgi:hypothetical protein
MTAYGSASRTFGARGTLEMFFTRESEQSTKTDNKNTSTLINLIWFGPARGWFLVNIISTFSLSRFL